MSATVAPLVELELGQVVPDQRFRIASPKERGELSCWCGRSIRDAMRPVLLVEVPREIGSFRGRPFHSVACAVAYASRAVNRIDRYLVDHPDGPRAESGRELRTILIKLMGELLSYDLTWL
jgi:hypothetical protein